MATNTADEVRQLILRARDTRGCVTASLAAAAYQDQHPDTVFPVMESVYMVASALKRLGRWDYELERKLRAEGARDAGVAA